MYYIHIYIIYIYIYIYIHIYKFDTYIFNIYDINICIYTILCKTNDISICYSKS